MSGIEIKSLAKSFSDLSVLKNINLGIKSGELITIFGPNGCGKTTLLYILAGIHEPDKGEISIDGQSPAESKVGIVFQNYPESIFPWRTVMGNVEFGLEVQGVDKEERRKKAEALLNEINLLEHKDKYPYQLSGGLKQLTAICRALAYDPNIFLLDEPFSALDHYVSRNMWLKTLKLWAASKKTTVFVSHNVDEAIFLADRVVVFSKRPAEIIGGVKIKLPRPRKLGIIKRQRFFHLRNRVLELFEEGSK